MNKKLILLFVSIYTLMALAFNGDNSILPVPDIAVNTAYCFGNSIPATTLNTSGKTTIGTPPCHPDKDLIRIKAWDNVLTLDVPHTWHFIAPFDHIEKVKFISYNATMLASYISVADLRGPPQPVSA